MKSRTPLLIVAAIVAMLTLAGCVPDATADPTSSPTATRTPTPTPTPTSGAAPTQQPTSAPTDQASAIAAANKAYIGYRAAVLQLLADPSLGVEYMSGYVLPSSPAAQVIEDAVRISTESGSRVSGGPYGWQANEAMSYAAPATDTTTGARNEFGSVQLYGCLDNTAVTFTNESIPKGLFPFNATLIYASNSQEWLVSYDHQLQPGEEAPQC